MATTPTTNPVLQFFLNWRQNLTTFEVIATAALDAQAVVLQLVAPLPVVDHIVSVGFGVLATVSLFVKNLLANKALAKAGK